MSEQAITLPQELNQHEAVHEASRWHRIVNAAKRNLAPLALVAAGTVIAPAAINADEAIAKQSHPVHHFRDANQGDYGSRMATTGCGPTSMGMVTETFKGDSRFGPRWNKNVMSPKFYVPGSGTLPSGFHYVAKLLGIHSENSSLQEAKDVLWDGGLAIVHAKPGHFTSAGHYMVLKSVNDAGKFRIADPNGAPGRDSEARWWSPRELKRAGIDDVWTFTPSENML